ncbi:serine/threonine kinase [Fragilaria crotonensis]|nr:serine/threonine kinase [Fragilaria crotonensis]
MRSIFSKRKEPSSANDRKLINSAFDGNLQEVRDLLRAGANVNAQRTDIGVTALYVASEFGHVEVVRALLQNNKVDVNLRRTDDGTTALYVASQNGQLEVVRELLRNNKVDVNLQHTCGSTALYMASQNGHVEVVRELLQNNKVDVNLQRTDDGGTTALYIASEFGHLEVVRALLQNNKVDVNLQKTGGYTALYIASEKGHVEIVRALLQNNKVDVNLQRTNDGTTALYTASQEGHVEVVRKLLRNNKVDVNLQMTGGYTALYIASEFGHVEVVRALLQNNKVDVNLRRTDDGTTALYVASQNGQLEVVRELLQNNKVDVNLQRTDDGGGCESQKTGGYTALTLREKGHVEIVRALLQNNKVDVNLQRTNDGTTALYIASQEGHVEVVRELLRNNKVDVNLQMTGGYTALYIASEFGHVEVVRALLQNNKVDVNLRRTDDGTTALYVASQNGQLEVVRELLRNNKVDVNLPNTNGATALYIACQNGHVEVVRELLQNNKLDVNLQRTDGQTALYAASRNGHVEVVRLLLQNNKTDVNGQRDDDGVTALFMASCYGHVEVVRLLLQNNKTDVNLQMTDGQTALYAASRNGHLEVVRLLLQNKKVDANLQMTGGFTPLYVASCNGHVEVVRLLLQNNKTDVNLRMTDGATPLMIASHNGHVEVVRELLQNNKVNVNLQRTDDGATALYVASQNGDLEVVRELLQNNKVNVNLQRTDDGATALYVASQNGHVEVVRALLQNNKVDLNLQCTGDGGLTPLDRALQQKHDDIVRLLKKHMEDERNRLEEEEQKRREEEERRRRMDDERKQAMEEKRRRQELLNRRRPAAASVAGQRVTGNPPRRNENSPPSDDAAIEKDRSKLFNVMSSTSKDHDPVELSHQYIEHCITKRTLGSGAFGDAFLAEDSHLPKKFAVKKVKLAQCDQDTINEIRKSFQRELSTLKRFHHPNIIVLYGYNLNASLNDQCLVYEYAANGSLDGFLRDDGNRARLTTDIRLSIMFEVARAVNFLHSGGCEGWKVFHRDIKSANICLAEDFTARLIDCGLAKFVPDENLNIVPGSVIPSVRSTTGGHAFGTRGYMCPECLINGQSTRNGTQFTDVFEKYVKDEDGELIGDGWKILEQDADPSIIWDPRSFRLVCKAAIRCITPTSKTRLSTSELLEELRTAITETPSPETNSAGDNRPFCIICNQCRTDMACSEGHPLCSGCIGNALGHSNGYHVSCLIDRCSSQPFRDEDLFGRVSVETYNRYIEKKVEHAKLDEILHGMRAVRVGVERNNQLLQEQQDMLQRLASGLERSLAALSLLAANQFKECPNLVWVAPISVEKQDLGNPKNWIRSALKQKYKVVFICAHSGQPGHEPFEIEVPKGWITKIAPWLKLCLLALKGAAGSQGLPFPIPDLSFLDQCGKMKTLLESVIEEGANAVLSRCETLLESGTMTIDSYGQMQTLAGDSFQLIAEKAQKEKRSQWKPPQMVPVCDRNGTIMWVKGEFQDHYRV